MGTIGYGDYYPCTYLGKILAFIMCLWGIFFISITFVSLINLIKLSSSEQNAFNLIQKIKNQNQLKDLSVNFIAESFRYYKASKQELDSPGLFSRIRRSLAKTKMRKACLLVQDIKQYSK